MYMQAVVDIGIIIGAPGITHIISIYALRPRRFGDWFSPMLSGPMDA